MRFLLSFMFLFSIMNYAISSVEINPTQVTTYATDFFDTYGAHPDVLITQATLEAHLNAQFTGSLSSTCINPTNFSLNSTAGNNITVDWTLSASATSYNLTILPLSTGISQTVNVPDPTANATFFSFTPGLYLLTIQSFCSATKAKKISIIIIDKPVQYGAFNSCDCSAFELMLDKSSSQLSAQEDPTDPVTANWIGFDDTEVYYVDVFFDYGDTEWHTDFFMESVMGPSSSPGPLNQVDIANFNNCLANNIELNSALDGSQFIHSFYDTGSSTLPDRHASITFSNQFVFHPYNFEKDITGSSWSVSVKHCTPDHTPEDPGGKSDEELAEQLGIEKAQLTASPNPSKGRTILNYALPKEGPINLELYNEYGQLVRTIAHNYIQPVGEHTYTLDWAELPTGIYTCRLSSATEQISIRLVRFK